MKSPILQFLAVASLFTLVGCNQPEDGKQLRTARQNLTAEEQRTLDFEQASDWYEWSNSSSVTLTSSTNASHGTHSLAVSGIGYAGLRNVNGLSKDGPAPEVVGYDVWIPENQVNPWWHGNTSLTIDCPSAGIWSQWIGSQSFNDLPKGQFVRVEYALPTWIRQALDSTNYNDLRFVVAINVESGSATHYVDHFTLGPADTTCAPADDQNPCTIDGCDASTGQPTHAPVPAGTNCDNGNVCDGVSTCNATGECTPGTPPDLSDDNACTEDSCDPVSGVTHTPMTAGTSCANENQCDGIEFCDAEGACQSGIPPRIDDEDPCTTDSCDPETGVTHVLVPPGTSCSDGDACNGEETCNSSGTCEAGTPLEVSDGNACTADSCDPVSGVTHTPAAVGTSCDDGDVCNGQNVCNEGATCVAGVPPEVSDGNPCTADSCDPIQGVIHANVAAGVSCGDGNSCNGEETCDGAGTCTNGDAPILDDVNACTADACDPIDGVTHTPVAVGTNCDDGDLCNGESTCNAVGECMSGVAPEVSDDNPCTVDSCDPSTGVEHAPIAAGTSCDDGDVCNGESLCDGGETCVAGAPPIVDDGNVCTADSCDPIHGVSHVSVAAGVSCGDGDVCNGDEVCDGAGACQTGTPVEVSDNDPCTADSCDPVTGVSHIAVAAGTSCSDDNLCNGDELCDGAGTCQNGTPVDTDDGNACTIGSCDPETGGVSQTPAPVDSPCGDGDVCNGSEYCDGAGECTSGSPLDPNDGNACTVDSCDPVFGVQHEPEASGTSCVDGDVCNGSEECNGFGECQRGTPIDPSDDNPCTADACDPVTGVSHTPVAEGVSCSDGDLCNGSETCDGSGACSAGEPLDPDDGNVCTFDSCDSETGVVHEPAPAGTDCDDGNLCTGANTCDGAGSCLSPGPADLDDGDPCTADACDPILGVTHELVAEGTPCSDGNACNGLEVCDSSGSCNPGTAPLSDDGNPCTADSCDPDVGVVNEPLSEGSSCDLGACMGTGICNDNALCERSAPALSPDSDPCTLEFCDEETGQLEVVQCSENNLAALTTAGSTMKFLYEGSNAVQLGVAPGVLNGETSGVVRGRVLWEDGMGVPNVRVEISGAPELGYTRTQIDGNFVMVVPGGREYAVLLAKEGYPSIHRGITVAARDQVALEDVVLVQRDHKTSSLRMNSPWGQMAVASEITDEDGTRTARVYIPPGTRSWLKLQDGTSVETPLHTLRATEYTVGERGEERMPAALPPTTAYTYALELTSDEAVAADAERIEFDRFVFLYTDNFLGFETGTEMPLGYVDERTGRWVAEPSGVTLEVVSETGGEAVITGHEDLDPALHPDAEELRLIADHFAPGDTFWRSALHHFSKWDSNQGSAPPDGAGPPPTASNGGGDQDAGGDDECTGSRIDPVSRSVAQDLTLVGTSEQLHHTSERAGRPRTLKIPVTAEAVPGPLKRVEVTVFVAGQIHRYRFDDVTPGQEMTFVWDGKDAMGRFMQGEVPIKVDTMNVYDAVYGVPSAFGYNGNGLTITNVPGRAELAIHGVFTGMIGGVGGASLGAAGLGLTSHHFLDRGTGRLYKGDGSTVSVADSGLIAERVFGGGTIPTGLAAPPVGANAADYSITNFRHNLGPSNVFTIGSDERLYVTFNVGSSAGANLAVVDPRGLVERTVSLDLRAQSPAVSKDGRIFFAYFGSVYEVLEDDSVKQVLGGHAQIRDIDVSADGAGLYLVSALNRTSNPTQLHYFELGEKLCVDAEPSDVAGCWARRKHHIFGALQWSEGILDVTSRCPRDDDPRSSLFYVTDLEVASSGEVYFSHAPEIESQRRQICRLNVDGTFEQLHSAPRAYADHHEVALGPDFVLLAGPSPRETFSSSYSPTAPALRRIDSLGQVTYQGLKFSPSSILGPVIPSQLGLGGVRALEATEDGEVMYVADSRQPVIWRIGTNLPRYGGQTLMPSEDGRELYLFHPDGRHQETRDARTNALLWRYEYDAALKLERAVRFDAAEQESEAIRLERDATGALTGIFVDTDGAGPASERAHAVSVTNEGYIAQLTNPAGESYALGYDNPTFPGLVTSFLDRAGRTSLYVYDDRGSLVSQTDPIATGQTEGGTFLYTPLEGTETDLPATARQTPLGHTSYFGEERGEAMAEEGGNSFPDGTTTSRQVDKEGNGTFVSRDGTSTTQTLAPNPETGAVHRYASETTTTLPVSGLTRSMTSNKTVSRASSGLISESQSVECIDSTQGDLCTTVTQNTAAGTRTTQTPAGRVTTEFLDALNRLTELRAPGAPAVRTIYDGDQVSAIVIDPDGVEGSGDERETTMEYDPSTGLLAKVIDPLTYETLFGGYDGADRPQTITLPDFSEVQMTYDPEGNVASVTPPGKAPHGMTYGPRGRIESYTPPVGNSVEFFYDLDRRMDLIDFGLDGAGQPNQVDFEYNPATGQLSTITSPTGTIQVGFTNGHMTSLTSPSVGGGITTSIGYDGFLPTSLSWSGTVSGEVNWTYNDRFLIETETIGALPETTVAYEYDDDGLVTQAGDLEITREPTSGRVVQKMIGRIRETFTYNEFAELSRQTVEFMELDGVTVKETLYDVVYDDDGSFGDRDALGRITKKTEWIVSGDTPNADGTPRALDARTYDYGYNPEGRPWLESVAVDGTVVSSYGYDDNGNRTSAELNWSQLGYDAKFDYSLTEADTVYNDADQLLVYGTKSYTWNNFGQLASMTDSDPNGDGDTSDAETTFYDYDLYGNLLRVDLPDGRAIEYEVDGAGRRVGRRELAADGTEISFRGWIYRDLLRPIAEVDRDGNVVARYVYEDGEGARQNGIGQLSTRLGANQDTSVPFSGRNIPKAIELLGAAGNVVQTLSLSTDQVGSLRVVANAETGDVLQRIEYDEFGRVIFDSSPGLQPFGFGGGLMDPEIGQVRFGARDYAPGVGRWTARDAARFVDTANPYLFVSNLPTMLVDPTGFHPWTWTRVLDCLTAYVTCGAPSKMGDDEFHKGCNAATYRCHCQRGYCDPGPPPPPPPPPSSDGGSCEPDPECGVTKSC